MILIVSQPTGWNICSNLIFEIGLVETERNIHAYGHIENCHSGQMHLKMFSSKCRPFCFGFNVLDQSDRISSKIGLRIPNMTRWISIDPDERATRPDTVILEMQTSWLTTNWLLMNIFYLAPQTVVLKQFFERTQHNAKNWIFKIKIMLRSFHGIP